MIFKEIKSQHFRVSTGYRVILSVTRPMRKKLYHPARVGSILYIC